MNEDGEAGPAVYTEVTSKEAGKVLKQITVQCSYCMASYIL